MKYSLVRKYKYKLEVDYAITISIDYDCHNSYISLDKQKLIIKWAYLWDGSSIPHKKWVPKWIYDFDKYCKDASLAHDALCQLMREDLLPKSFKEMADGIYRDEIIKYVEEKVLTKLKPKKARRLLKRVKRMANRRYRWLRKFGDGGIEKERYPRNTVFET